MLRSFSAMAHRLLALLLITSFSSVTVSSLRSCNALQMVSEQSPGENSPDLRTLLEEQEKAALAFADAVNAQYHDPSRPDDDFVLAPDIAKLRVLRKFYGFEEGSLDPFTQTDRDRLRDEAMVETLPTEKIESFLVQFLGGLWFEHVVLGWVRVALDTNPGSTESEPSVESDFRAAFTDWNAAKANFWSAAQEFFPEAAAYPAPAFRHQNLLAIEEALTDGGTFPVWFDDDSPDLLGFSPGEHFLHLPARVQPPAALVKEVRAEVLTLIAPVLEQVPLLQKLAGKELEARASFAQAWAVYRGSELQHLDLLKYFEEFHASFHHVFLGEVEHTMHLGIEHAECMEAWKREWRHCGGL